MPDWITKYWVEWVFGILCAVLAGLYRNLAGKVKRQKEEYDAVKNGLRALLQRQIIMDCESGIREGHSSVTRKNGVEDMYKCYHALGGNGAVTQLVETFKQLPTVKMEGGEKQ